MTAWTATVQGLTIGAGTNYRWATMPDGFGVENYRADDIFLPRQDGLVAGDDRLGGRMFTFDVWILGSSSATTVETRANLLKAAFQPQRLDVNMTFALSDLQTYTVVGRPRGCVVMLDRKFRSGVLRARCSFWATNPVLLATEVITVIGLPSGTAGLLFAATGPFVFGSSVGGSAILSNTGTYPADWRAIISGPLVGPTLQHVELGLQLGFPALSLAAGETLNLDSRTKTALLNNSASRYNFLSPVSRWWQLAPGNSTIRLTAASGTGNADVRFSPTYL